MSENVNIRNDANDEVEIDLVEVFGILMHHIWLIITVTLVCAPAPTVEQLLRLQTVLEQALGHAYRWRWRFQENPIPLGVGGKFEEFVSLIAEPGWAPRPSRCLNQ